MIYGLFFSFSFSVPGIMIPPQVALQEKACGQGHWSFYFGDHNISAFPSFFWEKKGKRRTSLQQHLARGLNIQTGVGFFFPKNDIFTFFVILFLFLLLFHMPWLQTKTR
ncbi:hypothetical protein BD289DRAFT_77177 [Coniella lustricola]|uniref:Uncharacterized protein n=1 Tax=Coniella lustricola TaxID=2025994 RepID=A0A2T2ZZG9_9PEZI|nr:hypothetical protein BD289DRAFT_77177 [Coniella lustricola]